MHFDPDTSEACVRWDPALPPAESGEKAASDRDQLMMVAYDLWGSLRKEFPTSYFVYVAFLSTDATDQASSVCLGAVKVGEV